MAIRFPIQDLRPLGRSARGVISMKLRTGDEIVGCDIVPQDYDADLLVVTSDGFGKRTKLSEFRTQNRGGIGLIATKFKSSASRLVALTIVRDSDDIMMVTGKRCCNSFECRFNFTARTSCNRCESSEPER